MGECPAGGGLLVTDDAEVGEDLRLDGPGLLPPLHLAVAPQQGVVLPLQLEQNPDLFLEREPRLAAVPLGLLAEEICGPVLSLDRSISHHRSTAPEFHVDS